MAATAALKEIRRHMPERVIDAASVVRRGTERAFGRAFAAAMSLLPLRVYAHMHEYFAVTAPLDYPHARIDLLVDSTIESVTRVRSCEKEPETIRWIEEFVSPGDILFDIGANVGAYSFVADRHTSGDARIYAFEPSFLNFSRLSQNVLLNGMQGRVIPLCVALSERTGLGTFHFSSLRAGAALHRLDQDAGLSPIAFHQSVLTYRMDELVKQFGLPVPNHLKIDVDGGEGGVIGGAGDLLRNDALRSILIEIDAGGERSAIIRQLELAGFEQRSEHPRGDSADSSINYVFARHAS